MSTKKEVWLKLLKAEARGKAEKAQKYWLKLLRKELKEKQKNSEGGSD